MKLLEWAAEVRHFFLRMNKYKNEDVHDSKTACEPVLLCLFEERYDELLQSGKLHLESMQPKSFGYDELRRMG